MRNKQSLSLKVRLGVAALALTMLLATAGGGLVAIQSAQGISPVGAMVVRAIFRTISHRGEERADRRAINQRRDVEVAEVGQQQQVLDFQRDRGWLDQAAYDQEGARLVALTGGINERARRERQIVSFQTRQNIRRDWSRAVEDVLTVSTGLNPRAIRFTGSLLRGERPITAAIDAALGGGREVVDPLQQFRDLRATLTEVQDGLRFVRGSAGLLARAQITRLVRQMGGPDLTSEEQEEALNRARQIGADVEEAVAQAGAIRADLFPRSARIDRERFANNDRWIMFNDNVRALSTSTAGRAVLSGLLRKGVERARELLEGSGITLTDEQLVAIAREAGSMYVEARLADGEVVDIDEIVRAAVNEALATAGLDPLPEATPEPGATEEPEPTSADSEGALTLLDVSVVLDECRPEVPGSDKNRSCFYTIGATMEYVTPRLPSLIFCSFGIITDGAEEDLSEESGTITVSTRVMRNLNQALTVFNSDNPSDVSCDLIVADGTVVDTVEEEVLFPLP